MITQVTDQTDAVKRIHYLVGLVVGLVEAKFPFQSPDRVNASRVNAILCFGGRRAVTCRDMIALGRIDSRFS